MNKSIMNKSIRILVVDDEPHMRVTLSDILEDEGYQVEIAASGEMAVEMCREEEYDVVLLDVRMPGIDGVEAFSRIRRHRPGVRVVMMSAYSMDDLKQQALADGAIAFMTKPLDIEKVVKLIDEVSDTAILVIEPDDETAKPMREALKQEGYRVTLTDSPHTALELVEQIRFDLIFIDVELPSMNGLELYLAIKKLTPTAVTIMIAGMDEEFESIAREAVQKTAYAFVKKPLELDYVLGMLRKVTHQRLSGDMRKPDEGSASP